MLTNKKYIFIKINFFISQLFKNKMSCNWLFIYYIIYCFLITIVTNRDLLLLQNVTNVIYICHKFKLKYDTFHVRVINPSFKPLRVFCCMPSLCLFIPSKNIIFILFIFYFRLHPYVLILVRLACQYCVLREADGCILVLRYPGIKDLLSTVQRRMKTLTQR